MPKLITYFKCPATCDRATFWKDLIHVMRTTGCSITNITDILERYQFQEIDITILLLSDALQYLTPTVFDNLFRIFSPEMESTISIDYAGVFSDIGHMILTQIITLCLQLHQSNMESNIGYKMYKVACLEHTTHTPLCWLWSLLSGTERIEGTSDDVLTRIYTARLSADVLKPKILHRIHTINRTPGSHNIHALHKGVTLKNNTIRKAVQSTYGSQAGFMEWLQQVLLRQIDALTPITNYRSAITRMEEYLHLEIPKHGSTDATHFWYKYPPPFNYTVYGTNKQADIALNFIPKAADTVDIPEELLLCVLTAPRVFDVRNFQISITSPALVLSLIDPDVQFYHIRNVGQFHDWVQSNKTYLDYMKWFHSVVTHKNPQYDFDLNGHTLSKLMQNDYHVDPFTMRIRHRHATMYHDVHCNTFFDFYSWMHVFQKEYFCYVIRNPVSVSHLTTIQTREIPYVRCVGKLHMKGFHLECIFIQVSSVLFVEQCAVTGEERQVFSRNSIEHLVIRKDVDIHPTKSVVIINQTCNTYYVNGVLLQRGRVCSLTAPTTISIDVIIDKAYLFQPMRMDVTHVSPSLRPAFHGTLRTQYFELIQLLYGPLHKLNDISNHKTKMETIKKIKKRMWKKRNEFSITRNLTLRLAC